MALFLVGCGSTPQKIVYQSLKTIGLSVQKSMQAAAEGRVEGKIDDKQWAKIQDLHDNKYLPAYRTACDLAAYDYTKAAPGELVAIAGQLETLVNSFLK